MMKCKADCLFNFDGKCTKQSKKDMTVIEKWKNDFKGFISELSMPEDDFYGIMQYIDEAPNEPKWIPVSERSPETDNENSINNYNVLLWVKNKSHPEREPQIYLGKLRHIDGDDGSGNFWGIETKPCDWTIWGWCYLNEPEVIAWMPLPKPYESQESEDDE